MASSNVVVVVGQHLLENLALQCIDDSQRWFPQVAPKPDDTTHDTVMQVMYSSYAMFGEVGEFANIVKKIARGSLDFEDLEVRAALEGELTDAFIYMMNLVGILKFDLLKAYTKKREFNEARFGNDNTTA